MKILMVCLGNICRSPLAEGILAHKTKHLNLEVDSAGTAGYHIGNLPDSRSIEIADKYNIDLSNQRARQFSRADFDAFDIIYAMDTNNYAHLISLASNKAERNKVRMILNEINPNACDSVPDPYYGGGNGFQNVYDMLEKACDKIVQNIE
ncbi:low molecular weight phosphotyrosine protein phosphatase [Flavobacteriales bacterium]|jgi:protein-tyrosine phosphatase|nr:low molecular weight phosphotyrosine protein phosphatase [Flavobacteriales bacterium]MDG1348337.1 low molecular weight phosphotyrosine protein phosphatase [Flavobacteriales bacterium]